MQIGVSMKELVIIIRPEKLEIVKAIIDDKKLGGMTISSVMGCGTQRGVSEDFTTINLLPKIKVEVVVTDDIVEELILEIEEKVRTNHVGDGKIFIRTIEDAIRIRTGERGDKVL